MQSSDNARVLVISKNQKTDPSNEIILDIDLDEFLDELEVIARFINKGIIDVEDAYQIFGTMFISVFYQNDINNYIKEVRKIQKNWLDQFESAVKNLEKIQNKELSK